MHNLLLFLVLVYTCVGYALAGSVQYTLMSMTYSNMSIDAILPRMAEILRTQGNAHVDPSSVRVEGTAVYWSTPDGIPHVAALPLADIRSAPLNVPFNIEHRRPGDSSKQPANTRIHAASPAAWTSTFEHRPLACCGRNLMAGSQGTCVLYTYIYGWACVLDDTVCVCATDRVATQTLQASMLLARACNPCIPLRHA
jgi:hypothetical protein